MLVDVQLSENCDMAFRLTKGIYQCYHWNFELIFRNDQIFDLDYPQIESEDYFGCYGVCDSPDQLLSKLPKSVIEGPVPYVISMVRLAKKLEPFWGGWRWHKWGEYIGEQNPRCEYLADEPEIEEVWTYHIYQVEPGKFIENE